MREYMQTQKQEKELKREQIKKQIEIARKGMIKKINNKQIMIN